MIRVAIVEDEKNYVSILSGYLKRYERENPVTFHIRTFSDGLDIVSDYAADYDIILLDIQMKHLDGMKTAGRIRELDEDVAFIFITSTVSFRRTGISGGCPGLCAQTRPVSGIFPDSEQSRKTGIKKQTQDYMTFYVEGDRCVLRFHRYFISKARNTISLSIPKRRFHYGRTDEESRKRSHTKRLLQMPQCLSAQPASCDRRQAEQCPAFG